MKEVPPVNLYEAPGVCKTPFTKIRRTASKLILTESGFAGFVSKLKSSPL